MLVDSSKMKHLRLTKNWTQQHLADVCGLSMRTIQRVEKDGVASNETVAAYAAVFEVEAVEFLISVEEYDQTNREAQPGMIPSRFGSFIFVGGFVAGIAAGMAIAMFAF